MSNTDHKSAVDLDLDILTKSKFIRLNGKSIELFPPKLTDLFKLKKLSEELTTLKGDDVTPEQVEEAMNKLETAIYKAVPEIAGERLTMEQIFAVMQFAIKMAVPSNLEELEKRGITMTESQKKILLDHSEKSPDLSTTTQDTPSAS